MTVVADASAVVEFLIGDGEIGTWAREHFRMQDVVAPAVMPFEVANVLRKKVLQKRLTDRVATVAHADLLSMETELFQFATPASRVWKLRGSLTAYDASYVALAEFLDAPLVTLDRGLARMRGTGCRFITPPGGT